MKAIIGRKIGTTSLMQADGAIQAVTLVQAAPNVVTQVKSVENDGYLAVQLGLGENPRPAKPQAGHAKANTAPRRLAEFRTDETVSVGDTVSVTNFELGDKVKVTGLSKGKGFAGTIKRHNFHRGPKTHGSRNYRKPGSIGSMYPQKVFKGKKMAGRMGGGQVTVRNLKVALVDAEHDLIGLTGAIPGPAKSIVRIQEI
ncbi:MAG TPA: 50S ribosomal protein L3 [Candidatus Saccharimonadales bacterium]